MAALLAALDVAIPDALRGVAHVGFELLAYLAGAWLYRRGRRREGDVVGDDARWTVIAAAAVGAAVGSKVLHWFAAPSEVAALFAEPVRLLPGKTIVGALLGGWLAVELAKRLAGVRARTGDLLALPLLVGIGVGRLGCFLAGPIDATAGRPTGLPWAVDHGDGVARHPAALYEVLAALGLALLVRRLARVPGLLLPGDRFRLAVGGYLLARVLLDASKPYERVAGLGVLQWCGLIGAGWALAEALRDRRAARRDGASARARGTAHSSDDPPRP